MCGFKSGLWTAAQLHYSLLSPKRDASSIPLESLSTPFIVCPPHSTRRVFDMRSKSSCYMTRLIIFCFARREQRPVSVGLSSLRRNRWPSRPWMASWKMTLWSSHMYVGWTCLMAASGCNELFLCTSTFFFEGACSCMRCLRCEFLLLFLLILICSLP